MAKITIALKTDPDKAELIKQAASSAGKTTSEYLNDLITNNQSPQLQAKIESLQGRIKYLETLGKKIPTHKRISIPFTFEEWQQIDQAAHKAGIPKTQLLRAQLFRTQNRPELE